MSGLARLAVLENPKSIHQVCTYQQRSDSSIPYPRTTGREWSRAAVRESQLRRGSGRSRRRQSFPKVPRPSPLPIPDGPFKGVYSPVLRRGRLSHMTSTHQMTPFRRTAPYLQSWLPNVGLPDGALAQRTEKAAAAAMPCDRMHNMPLGILCCSVARARRPEVA